MFLTRTVRALFLVIGIGAVAGLVWRMGPGIVARMLVRVGWTFLIVAAIYGVQVLVRALALWRVLASGSMPYMDVLRIRLSGEAVETLTFSGPFLAEPAKGWLLKRRGVPVAAAFAAVITEYLLYTFACSCLAIAALTMLSSRMPPGDARFAIGLVLGFTLLFAVAFVFASVTGIGLIVPSLRAAQLVIGRRRAQRVADDVAPVEELIIGFLHGGRRRLAEVFIAEAVTQALMVFEVWIVLETLGSGRSWLNAATVEGGVKFVSTVFVFIPGQFGASEAVYAWLASVMSLSAAVGLSLALVRRLRSLLIAAIGIAVLSLSNTPRSVSTNRAE